MGKLYAPKSVFRANGMTVSAPEDSGVISGQMHNQISFALECSSLWPGNQGTLDVNVKNAHTL